VEKDQVIKAEEGSRQVIGRHMLTDGLNMVADLQRSQGSRIYDVQSGEYYLDLFSCFATMPLGFSHPRLCSPEARDELAAAALQKPTCSDLYTRELAAFVDTYARVGARGLFRYMFFIEGGALAVENALKTAFDWKVRKNLAAGKEPKGGQVIYFKDAFHGRSGYTLSMTNTADPRKTQYFPKFDWPRVSNPMCRFPLTGDNLEQTIAAERKSIAEIEQALEERADDIACLIIEPIQSEGGDRHFRSEFHQQLRKLCDENEILFIYDEVQTGWGGTGKFWAAEHFVLPDIICFGKKSQVCGILVGDRVDEVPDNVFHVASRINSTWGGNLVDMVRARLYLEIFESDRILERTTRLGSWLLAELTDIQEEFPGLISNVRGLGLMCAFDLPDREARRKFIAQLFENRIIMLGCGDRSVRFRTALTIKQDDLKEGLTAIRNILSRLGSEYPVA